MQMDRRVIYDNACMTYFCYIERNVISWHLHSISTTMTTTVGDHKVTGNSNEPVEPQSEGYMLTLTFGRADQHGVAASSVQNQQCWLKSHDLNIHVVEPFAVKSHFESYPRYWNIVDSGGEVLRFGDYFDMDYYHSLLRKDNVPNISSWENFLENAPRNVIAVTIDGSVGLNRRCFGLIGQYSVACRRGHRNQQQIDYFTSGCNTSAVDTALVYLQKHYGFKLHRSVCLNCNHGLPKTGYSPQDIVKHIFGKDDPKKVTLVINMWYFKISLVPDCKLKQYCAPFNLKQFVPSSRLQRDAQRYVTEILNASSISIAIMFRTERMFKHLISLKNVLARMDSMLQTYRDKVSSIKNSPNFIGSKPLITIDIGSYGSDSNWYYCPECRKYSKALVRKFEYLLSTLYPKRSKWTLGNYENGFSRIAGVQDRGYISALQRELASHAQCLMLYPGAGRYQTLVENNYKENHSGPSHCILHL